MFHNKKWLLCAALLFLLPLLPSRAPAEAGLLGRLFAAPAPQAALVGVAAQPDRMHVLRRILADAGWALTAQDGPLFRAEASGLLARTTSELARLLLALGQVHVAGPDIPFSAGGGYGGHQSQFAAFEDDLSFSSIASQPAMNQIGLRKHHSKGGARVAVLDGGFELQHEAVPHARILEQYDARSGAPDAEDAGNHYDDDLDGHADNLKGHGTAVLALIDAVAPTSQFLLAAVLDDEGRGSSWTVARGLQWALEQRADVINLSAGADERSDVVEYYLEAAAAQGALVISTAGNGGTEGVAYPARSERCLGVGAVTLAGRRASVSSYGFELGVSAPGESIVAPYPGTISGYGRWFGTSMSSAIASGVVARDIAANNVDAQTAWQHLQGYVAPFTDLSPDEMGRMGTGIIHVAK
jgi:hypothetical protein